MLKCAHFADFLDFENGCCYLNTIARKRGKTHGFLAFFLKIIYFFIGLNTSLSYIRMVMGEKLCLNVPFWSISKILKVVAATLTQLHVMEKNTGFFHFCLRTYSTLLIYIHHWLTFGWSWEKNYLKIC